MKTCLVALSLSLISMVPIAYSQNGDAKAKSLADSVNQFGVELYGALPDDRENRFFSPYSIVAALGMTREGAAGETAAEMDRVFHFPEELARHQVALREALTPRKIEDYDGEKVRKVPAYQLEIANALWGQEGNEFVPAFLKTLEQDYVAPLERIDFRQGAAARKRINAWVEEKTHDRIKDIVQPPLPAPDTRLTLANAIYFKANWSDPFKESATEEAPFHFLSGKTGKVPMMRRIGRLGYGADGSVQVVELAYRGDDTSMVLVVPKQRDGLPAVEAELSHEKLGAWLGRLKTRKVDLGLPRFEFTVPLGLTGILARMGMPLAFSAEKADFSGMSTEEPLFIGAVLHKAFVGVDEKGTEAAAATVVMMRAGSAFQPEEPVVVHADRPFLFLIRERRTGCILFMGRVMSP